MQRKILKTFCCTYGWDYSLEVRHDGGSLAWVNAIAWARANLANEKERILLKEEDVEGGDYLLVRDAEERARRKLRERDMLAIRVEKEGMIGTPKKKRVRAAAEVDESDAVYIIIDPKRPGCCKIGAGNGDCEDRLVEAKRWTNYEAQRMHVEPVGSGLALKVEGLVRRELEKRFVVNGEWVQCTFADAKVVLEAWRKKAQESAARMAAKG